MAPAAIVLRVDQSAWELDHWSARSWQPTSFAGLFPSQHQGIFQQIRRSQSRAAMQLSGGSGRQPRTPALMINPYGWRLIWNPFDMAFNQKLQYRLCERVAAAQPELVHRQGRCRRDCHNHSGKRIAHEEMEDLRTRLRLFRVVCRVQPCALYLSRFDHYHSWARSRFDAQLFPWLTQPEDDSSDERRRSGRRPLCRHFVFSLQTSGAAKTFFLRGVSPADR